jgi:hypothetical protein
MIDRGILVPHHNRRRPAMQSVPTLAAQLAKGDRITDGTTVGTIITPVRNSRRPGHVTFLVAANSTNYNVTIADTDRLDRLTD